MFFVIQARVRKHLTTLMGLKRGDNIPAPANRAEKLGWKQHLSISAVGESISITQADMEAVESSLDPQFPFKGGPGGVEASPQVILTMWLMMKRTGVTTFRPNWEAFSCEDNTFLWKLATKIFIQLCKSGEYKDVTTAEAECENVLSAIKKHARESLARRYVNR